MGNKRSLLGKGRLITSTVLAASMVLSGMSYALPSGTVYAATEGNAEASNDSSSASTASSAATDSSSSSTTETSTVTDIATEGSGEKTVTESNSASSASTQDSSSTSGDSSSATSNSASSEASLDAASSASSDESSDAASSASSVEDKTVETPTTSDEYTIDVWDFGAEQLEGVNNQLTVDIINSFYDSSIEAGSSGVAIASFTAGDLSFDDGGYSTTHRLRTTNTSITRYDAKSKTDADGNTYAGFLYSNKSSTEDVYLSLSMK